MRVLVVGGVILVVGILLGYKSHEPEVDIVRITDTKVVTETEQAPPAEPYIPQSCLDAIELAEDINRAAYKLDSYTTRQLDILSAARMAENAGPGATTEVEEDQRKLQGETVETVALLSDLQLDMKQAKSDCNEDSE